jgi:cytochrome oxidase assembly protein ShyY1
VLVDAPETATAVTVITPVTCCEPAKLAKLPPWQVRRLNRIADRQAARDARKCCCDPCECQKVDACGCKTRAVVVEARR